MVGLVSHAYEIITVVASPISVFVTSEIVIVVASPLSVFIVYLDIFVIEILHFLLSAFCCISGYICDKNTAFSSFSYSLSLRRHYFQYNILSLYKLNLLSRLASIECSNTRVFNFFCSCILL